MLAELALNTTEWLIIIVLVVLLIGGIGWRRR